MPWATLLRAAALAATSMAAACALFHGPLPPGTQEDVVPAEDTIEAIDAIRADRGLDAICARAAAHAVSRHAGRGLAHGDVGVAVIEINRSARLGQHSGFTPFEPGELAALPLAVEAMRQRSQGMLTDHLVTGPLNAMLADGRHGAINAMIDALSDAEDGPTLIGPSLQIFLERRRTIDRGLQGLGLYGLSVTHHLSRAPPTGREAQAAEQGVPPTNQMTPVDTARLLCLLETRQIISAARAERIMERLTRPAGATEPAEIVRRLPPRLMEGAEVWGSAAWTGEANHAAWMCRFPNGRRVGLAIFTRMDLGRAEIVQEIADEILSAL